MMFEELESIFLESRTQPELDNALMIAYDYVAYSWYSNDDSSTLFCLVQDRLEKFSDIETALDLLSALEPNLDDKTHVNESKLIRMGKSMQSNELEHLITILSSVRSRSGRKFLEELAVGESRIVARHAKSALEKWETG